MVAISHLGEFFLWKSKKSISKYFMSIPSFHTSDVKFPSIAAEWTGPLTPSSLFGQSLTSPILISPRRIISFLLDHFWRVIVPIRFGEGVEWTGSESFGFGRHDGCDGRGDDNSGEVGSVSR